MGAPAVDLDRIAAPADRVAGVVDALLDDAQQSIDLLDVSRLQPHPDNPREQLGDLTELAASIRSIGILEPLIVATASAFQAVDDRLPALTAEEFVVIAGHRRLAAAREAGLTSVRCIIRDDLVGEDAEVSMLVENMHREDLTALEEAGAFARLRDKHAMTQRRIAELVGCNQSHVSKRLSLVDLPPEVQAKLSGPDAMPIADAVAIAKYADKPSVVKAIVGRPNWQTVDQAAEKALRKADLDEQIAEAKSKARAKGLTVVKFDAYTHSMSVPRTLEHLEREGVDISDHEGWPCHAVMIGAPYNQDVQTIPVCVNPKVHPECADNARSRAVQDREAKLDRERAAATKRHDARLVIIKQALSRKIDAETEALALRFELNDLLEQNFDEREYEQLVDVLGLTVNAPTEAEGDPVALTDCRRASVDTYIAKGTAELKRVFTAATLVRTEISVEYGWASSDGDFMRWLQSRGHKPSGPERELLKKADA